MSAITVSPRRRRLGLYFALQQQNITTPDVEAFVSEILVHREHGLILVLDRWQVHRSAARRLLDRFPRRLQIEWLPPYAPQLDPVEQVWVQAKYRDLANFLPQDVADLRQAVHQSLRQTRTQQPLLRSFFKHAQLRL